MKTPPLLPEGPWQELFRHALTLMDEVAAHGTSNPFWTLGGGTVLMLRYRHRVSKDIDIFVPDPQYLGYVTPRLSDFAAGVTQDYDEGAQHVKLFLPQGEIDFVASPNLTTNPYEEWILLNRVVNVETSTEIVAKKCGTEATAPPRATCLTCAWLLSGSRMR